MTAEEWELRASRRLYNYIAETLVASVALYGRGMNGKRQGRLACLLKGRDTWLLDMRTTLRSDITQGYADELWLDLMMAAEQQAARDVLGDASLALRFEPKQGKAR